MYVYDMVAIVLIAISHVILYIQVIRYNRLPYTMVIALSIVFTILLGIVVTVTGYPEFNIIILLLFLLSLGLIQDKLTFMQNLYFALVSMVSITLVKMVLLDFGMKLFMLTPFNLYLWTSSVIHLIVSIVIVISIVLWCKPIQKLAQFIVDSPLYYVSYVLLAAGLIIELILTMPSTNLLATLHQKYGEISYIAAIVLFFVLLLILLISWHLTKEKILEEHQEHLDKELLDYVEKLEFMHDELASFRHDYMNVLLALEEGVRTKNLTQIEQVYYDVIAPTSKLINNRELDIVKLSRVNIPEVKSVLSVKVVTSQQQQVKVMVDIPQTIETIAMPVVTFIRAISILLDNAIEETVRSKDKMLQVAFFEMEERQYFIVRNSCRHKAIDLQQIYKKLYSSKEGNRGYGLFSLKRMIDKTDNATLETTFVAPYFTQTLILKKQ
ncbi:GHKL domain-containing protein [Aneurinibacillus migulanus]|uniref:Histidine kinase n=1 Tax=Aneurinibacillus migulanus TaxID=47500 RepID=A0A0D1V7M2_ANEMI|nr:GHKL domain-containing protein [Aneurinibacillus migulanus]KIV55359.1 histidine kinase [Aneurinibacillus migulanus]KON96647.1 histidine kinase [Aneurinibacillus migulanus]MED0896440.1 GHKL domain-containing protein [Aneurinibacillus migulanus]MED1618192.1 GHKL domain-containing protein [Aneurinibacillus migulanus]SDJ84275.1 two-component system, AgrA family, sensor histidine kinase AgrC [Aneurinibacillus migulanus]